MRWRLAAREQHPLLADLRLVALGQRADEVMGVGGPGGGHDRARAGVRVGVGDVLPDGGGEQHRVLQHDGELPAQVGEPVLPQVDAVEQDLPSTGS
jgi:hypothetical protein